MALQYTENGIHFNNLKPTTRGDGAIPAYDQYYMADTNEPADKSSNGYIARPEYTYINAIDVDWGEAQLASSYQGPIKLDKDGNPLLDSQGNLVSNTTTIKRTSELLDYIQHKINESDFVELLKMHIDKVLNKDLNIDVKQDSNDGKFKLYID